MFIDWFAVWNAVLNLELMMGTWKPPLYGDPIPNPKSNPHLTVLKSQSYICEVFVFFSDCFFLF